MRALIIVLILAARAFADPGPLSKSHAGIACAACHDKGAPAAPDDKCRACHKEQLVMHASGSISKLPCETCHLEHKGASFDITAWDTLPGGRAKFDHARANWPIDSHAKVACTTCHPKTNRQGLAIFRGANPSCLACHAATHDKAFTTDAQCAGCHVGFDHAKVFPIGPAHRATSCAQCHANVTRPPPKTCDGCHATKSPHGTRFTQPCITCHPITRGTWRAPIFKHATFVMSYQHASLACTDCHTNPGFKKVDAKCLSCHATVHVTDAKKPKYTEAQCLQCHLHQPTQVIGGNRLIELAHGTTGVFPLTKEHRDLACGDCHATRDKRGRRSFSGLTSECAGCHPDGRTAPKLP